jgi:hypothetical protein
MGSLLEEILRQQAGLKAKSGDLRSRKNSVFEPQRSLRAKKKK